MNLRILIFIVLSGCCAGHAQTSPVFGLESYRTAVHAVTDETIRLLLAWEKACILNDKSAETKAYDTLKQHVKKTIRNLRAIQPPAGDPGFHEAAIDLVKYVHNECNLSIAEIHDNPPSYYTAQENKERFSNKRTDVVSLTRAREERFLFREALLLAKFSPPNVEPNFCNTVREMVSAANEGFAGFQGGLRGTGSGGKKEYETLKMIPGAMKGVFVEQEDLPGVEYILFESSDSTEAARRVHEITIAVLTCGLPGWEGTFEWRVDHRVLKNESPNLHTRYQIWHRVGDGYLEPCRIEVVMRRPYGKYEAVLAFIRFK